MNNKDKNLKDLIINWKENNSIEVFKKIIVLIKNEKFYSPINEANDFKIENIVSVEGKLFIPAYIGIEQSVTDNKTMKSYTLRDYQKVLVEDNNDDIKRFNYRTI